MNKKQIEVEKTHLKLEKEALNELKQTYQKALEDIQERIKVLQSDEVLESKIRQLNYQKALENQVSGILDVLKTDNVVLINKYLTEAYENGFVGTLYNLQNEEIPLALGIDQKQVLTSISKKIDDMTFADREYQNMNEFKKKIKAEITRGIANNAKYAQIARQLDFITKEGVNSSYRIARTEMGRVSQESKFDCMLKAKENGADIVKQWDSTMDGRTREAHARLDGQVRELDEPFEIDGMKAMYPHGFGRGDMDINCRCVVLERARWAVEAELSGENTFTKAVRNKDGITEIKEFNTSSYKKFKKDYFKWKEEVENKIPTEAVELFNYINKNNLLENLLNVEDKGTILNKILGYDKLPTKISKEEYEEIIKNSKYSELYRGIIANTNEQLEKYINDFYYGDFYVGYGTYGRGTYVGYGSEAKRIATSYADTNGNGVGEVINMAINNANVIGKDEAMNMVWEECDKIDREIATLKKAGKTAEAEKLEQYMNAITNEGFMASIKGYDAIDVGGGYMVVLNRGKVVFYE